MMMIIIILVAVVGSNQQQQQQLLLQWITKPKYFVEDGRMLLSCSLIDSIMWRQLDVNYYYYYYYYLLGCRHFRESQRCSVCDPLCTLKLDEEKSKHAGLSQENDFRSCMFAHFAEAGKWRNKAVVRKSVINTISLLLPVSGIGWS
jgi:hypothetical protein